MLDKVGSEMLNMLGYGKRIPGAINAEDLPQARDNLLAALDDLPEPDENDSEEEDAPIPLRNRALPLIQLIDATIKAEEYLRWD